MNWREKERGTMPSTQTLAIQRRVEEREALSASAKTKANREKRSHTLHGYTALSRLLRTWELSLSLSHRWMIVRPRPPPPQLKLLPSHAAFLVSVWISWFALLC